MTNKYYYKDGSVLDHEDDNKILHREDGPAIEDADGYKAWYIDGKQHREDGPAVEWHNGSKFWYINDKPHREDGPAAEFANGDKGWYINGKRHREDGPAVEWADGYKEWYLDGIEYSKEAFETKLKQVDNMSDIELITSPEQWIRKRVKREHTNINRRTGKKGNATYRLLVYAKTLFLRCIQNKKGVDHKTVHDT